MSAHHKRKRRFWRGRVVRRMWRFHRSLEPHPYPKSYLVPIHSELLDQVRKMLQLKEALDQRMGCVIVGPSGCGKSTLWSILRHAMIKCGQPVNTHVVNPKSMPRQVRECTLFATSVAKYYGGSPSCAAVAS